MTGVLKYGTGEQTMRYTIEGFSQAFAMTLKKEVDVNGKTVTRKIDCTDLVILRWFVDFYPNMKKIEVDGRQYAWLTHKKLQNDLPLVDINKRSFIDRMQKLVDFEILDYQLLKEGGTFSLYTFGKNYVKLIQDNSEGMQSNDIGECNQNTEGMQSNDTGVCNQTDNKDNSIKDRSIKDTSIKDKDISAEFEILWKMYPRKLGKPKALKSYTKARKNGVTFEQVKQGIENYCKEICAKGTKTEYIKHGSTWFNGECWNDDYDFAPTSQRNKTYGANGIAIDKNAPDDLDGIL